MAATRSPSPTGDASRPGSPDLSPRSKIRAMLATVDSDDEDANQVPAGPIDVKALFKPAPKSADATAGAVPSHHVQGDNDHNDDDDDNEDEIALPRGRMARRMQARPKTPEPAAAGDATPSSPGLFVTPSPNQSLTSPRHAAPSESESDNDAPQDLSKNERFKALVARKREERLAKEAEESRKQQERAERMAQQAQIADDGSDDDVSDISDDAGGRKLTQDVARPARKAGKKALEEMNRETQRLSRSLQLAHEAKTKKKITKASLFERFNFKTANPQSNTTTAAAPSSSRPSSPNSANHTDAEAGEEATPPSSPPVSKETANPQVADAAQKTSTTTVLDDDEEIPDIAAVFDQAKKKVAEKSNTTTEVSASAPTKPKRQVRVKLPPMNVDMVQLGADDDLEVHVSRSKVDAIFNKLPGHLGNISSPPKETVTRGKKTQTGMTIGELQMSLQQRARAQAKLERERRVEFLRSKGVEVQTEEERMRDQEKVENMVERARQEAEEIMRRELEAAKQERKEKRKNGDVDVLDWDDSDDESFQGSDNEEAAAEFELSGSEDEEEGEAADDEDGDEADEEAEERSDNPLVMNEAEDSGSDGETAKSTVPSEARAAAPISRARKDRRQVLCLSDDEEDQINATPKSKLGNRPAPKSPSAPGSGSPQPPTSVLRSASKNFIPGLPVAAAGPAGLGLTQIFAGTMENSQPAPSMSGEPQEFMPTFDAFPDSQFSATAGQSQDKNDTVLNSQPSQPQDSETQGVQLHYSQSQAHGFDSLMRMDSTQASEVIQPTQDGGFQDFTPLKQRFIDAPQSTVDTVMVGTAPEEDIQQSPLVKKKGKLIRRGDRGQSSAVIPRSPSPTSRNTIPTEEKEAANENQASDETQTNAFKRMEKATRKEQRRKKKFNKKKSKATEMVEEQAQESEDEYAGLGGADGEDSSDEDEELTKEMIDDAAGNDGDERKLAQLHGQREFEEHQKRVDKLYEDITRGNLLKRHRGGNDLDLSSDDEEAARVKKSRRNFERMQKALASDERIGKIAENPRNSAFLKSLADQDSDNEMDFDDHFAAAVAEHSQSQTEESIPDSQPSDDKGASVNAGRKRSRMEPHDGSRAPPSLRGKNDHLGIRPTSLKDVQKTLSSLLEEPDASSSIIPATDAGSDEEPDAVEADKENRHQPAVVNRMRLNRGSSSASSGSRGSSAGARPAFESASGSGVGSGFKVPALLRRATTNNSLISASNGSGATSSWNTTTGTGTGSSHKTKSGNSLLGDDVKIKKNAGKGSGVNYFARETERRAAVAESEKRREKRKWKGVEGREKAFGGLFGQGGFE